MKVIEFFKDENDGISKGIILVFFGHVIYFLACVVYFIIGSHTSSSQSNEILFFIIELLHVSLIYALAMLPISQFIYVLPLIIVSTCLKRFYLLLGVLMASGITFLAAPILCMVSSNVVGIH